MASYKTSSKDISTLSTLVKKSLFEKDYALDRKRPVYYVQSKNAYSSYLSLFLSCFFFTHSVIFYFVMSILLFSFFTPLSIRFPFFLLILTFLLILIFLFQRGFFANVRRSTKIHGE